METTASDTPEKARRRSRWRSFLLNGIAVCGGIGLLSLLGFADHTRSKTPIHTLEVDVNDASGRSFLDSSSIAKLVLQAQPNLIGTPAELVNLDTIHQLVVAHPSIRQVQAFVTVDGRCVVKAIQRIPMARVLNQDGSGFYIDEEGFTMPLSRHATADVPLFTGRLLEKMHELPVPVLAEDSTWRRQSHLDEILSFTRFLKENEFMNAQVEHVVFNEKGEMEIVPRVGNHRIVVGDASDLELKYKKLLAFYAHTLHTRDLNQYRRINLKFDNQVVCEKN
jgi:cell division protein FtsQ